MAGASGGRSLEETPTWAVAAVCFVLVLISIIIEHIIHLIARWLKKKHKRALYQALEKVKAELMLLGFISLLLTVGQDPISRICISKKLGSTWHPCGNTAAHGQSPTTAADADGESRRRLLAKAASGATSINLRRVLAGATEDKCAAKVEIFVFALFNENKKEGGASERSFGIFNGDESKVYEVDLSCEFCSGSGDEEGDSEAGNGNYNSNNKMVARGPSVWCVAELRKLRSGGGFESGEQPSLGDEAIQLGRSLRWP
ncbi:MLO-like protein 2 [Linum perenne]